MLLTRSTRPDLLKSLAIVIVYPPLLLASDGDGRSSLRCFCPPGSTLAILRKIEHLRPTPAYMTEFYANPEPEDSEFFALLTGSYARLVGKPLGAASATWLY